MKQTKLCGGLVREGDEASWSEGLAEEGIRLHLPDEEHLLIRPRQARAAWSFLNVMRRRSPGNRVSLAGGDPEKGFAEIRWRTSSPGLTEPVIFTLFVGFSFSNETLDSDRNPGPFLMTLKLYNTLSRSLEKFEPLVPGKVLVYGCGPTIYDYPHIGNFRTFVAFDLLHRFLEWSGYRGPLRHQPHGRGRQDHPGRPEEGRHHPGIHDAFRRGLPGGLRCPGNSSGRPLP